MGSNTAVETKLSRAALILMTGLAVAGASASLAGNIDVASVLALAELDVIWITLLAGNRYVATARTRAASHHLRLRIDHRDRARGGTSPTADPGGCPGLRF
jgi:hypothetical protein